METTTPRLTRRSRTGQDPYFYFNVADESHAKILEQSRKVDPMEMISQMVEIDEY